MTFSANKPSFLGLAMKIQEEARALGGVLTYADFFNLLPLQAERKVRRAINKLIAEGVIFKIKRGVYATKTTDLWVLASRLCPRGYISTDNVLSKNGLIGTIPARRVFILSPLPKKLYKTPAGMVYSLQIKKELMFGYSIFEKGIPVADNEKAFLDLAYFYQRGIRFVASTFEGIDLEKLNRKKLSNYLKAYQDKKFINLVKGIFNGTR